MPKCPACLSEISAAGERCPECGTVPGDSLPPTMIKSGPGRTTNAAGPTGVSLDGARFAPGTILDERYRIVGLLGQGGMGEVYRADDLRLSQQVALKFLPERFSADPAALARFHREVSLARQVSHPNVCRVFDIGTVEGLHFITMEYINGEDLASLLRRIGRLPDDKANEVSRQICAGLAAAHEAGVLHRDLKPANIMIDGQGRARLTDFGLAVAGEEFREGDRVSGTLAYMAPEQLAHGEVTKRSDIYSLGLVLYEIYTGKRVFEAGTVGDLLEVRRKGISKTPSSWIRDLDPQVERAILRCLEEEPADRPAGALQVAAALPGGDPLAAALAAGEVPSPEMVAAAPKEGALPVGTALLLLASVVVGFIAVVIMADRAYWYTPIVARASPEVLAGKAREIAAQLGHPGAPIDADYGIHADSALLNHLGPSAGTRESIEKLHNERPVPVHFWYREHHRGHLYSTKIEGFLGEVETNDPDMSDPGMILLELDFSGNLIYFSAVPERGLAEPLPETAPDWDRLVRLAGLDPALLSPDRQRWVAPFAYSTRSAWTGTYHGQAEPQVHVEAAALGDKITYFFVADPWAVPRTGGPGRFAASNLFIMAMFSLLVVGAVLLARRNLRNGWGNRRGAFRLGVVAAVADLGAWVLNADHIPSGTEATLIAGAIGSALFLGVVIWFIYIALEPLVRRRSPELIISWSRALEGRFTDPLVGRDVLIGLAAATALTIFGLMETLLGGNLENLPAEPTQLDSFLGLRHFAARQFLMAEIFVLIGSGAFFLIWLLRILLRKDWLAGSAFVLIATLPGALAGFTSWTALLSTTATFVVMFVVARRFGLLAFGTMVAAGNLLAHPWTLNTSVWYFSYLVPAALLVLAIAYYGFRTALAGQEIFGKDLLDEFGGK